MTNKEIVTEIVDSLENTVGLNWPTGHNAKLSKEKLIECWSDYRNKEYEFYSYSSAVSLSRAYIKLFYNIDKFSKAESWKSYILKLYNYKYCTICKNIYKLNNFRSTDIRCKTCDKNYHKLYYKENREKILTNCKEYYKNNKPKYIAKDAKRRASKLQRTPTWLTEEDQWMFNEIYSLAKQREELTGIKWHVDHIIPLHGTLVCGLHVPTNLQVITAKRNLEKSNKYVIEEST
jgi:hypothetical protein